MIYVFLAQGFEECEEKYNKFLNSGFYVFKRDDLLSLEQTMKAYMEHHPRQQKENKHD